MDLFNVNQKKCVRCGNCVNGCPMRIIEMEAGTQGAFPNPAPAADALCIHCGHCIAICPHEAFTHKDISPDKSQSVQGELLPTPEQVEHLLLSRRSIRNFKDQSVNRETLTRLIDIVRYAPSSRNSQPVHWIIVCSRGEVKKLVEKVIDYMHHLIKKEPESPNTALAQRFVADHESGLDSICWSAPHVIVAHSPKGKNLAHTNCTIALAQLELSAPSFGLGACWVGYFNMAVQSWLPLQNALNIPKGNTCHGAMVIGYPEYQYHRIPIRNKPEITWR